MVIGPQLPDPRTRGDVSDGPVELLPVTGLRRVWATKMGAGLQNLGNTCYMNSVLQCLAYLPPVASGVQMNVLHGLPSSCPLAQTGKLCTCCAISKQLSDQLSTFDRAIRPVAISTALPQLSKAFVRGRQEDAHEFLLAVLEAVERDIKRGVVELGGLKSQVTLIEELFMGQLRSQVVCGECGYCSNSYEQVTTLSLDVPRGAAAASLTASLTAFTKPETLDGANKYKCDRCKRLVRATKALSIHHEPNILVVHLKRFDALSLSSKISRHVDFGHTLDLAPYSCAAAAASSGKAGAKVNGTANGHGGTTSRALCAARPSGPPGRIASLRPLPRVRSRRHRPLLVRQRRNRNRKHRRGGEVKDAGPAGRGVRCCSSRRTCCSLSRTELRSLPPPPYVPPPPAAGVAQASVPLAQLLAPGSGERKRLRGLLPAPLRHQAWQRAQDAHQAAYPAEPKDQGPGGPSNAGPSKQTRQARAAPAQPVISTADAPVAAVAMVLLVLSLMRWAMTPCVC
ncbi:hypothetical protein QJQ45_016369 [Haematococcus lacustris]|nr:hypothetical protein QJQ45_016369 [Haematococcus lacustris]